MALEIFFKKAKKVPPLVLFYIYCWLTEHQIFLKAPIYINFEGKCAPRKIRNFLVKTFQKGLKNPFWLVFSKNCGSEKLGRNRVLDIDLGELGKTIWLTIKKAKIFKSG